MRQLIKKLLPDLLLVKVKSFIRNLHENIQPFFAKTPFLSRLYFTFFNAAYQREQYSTLQGMLTYNKRIKSTSEESSPLLRRNVHRLEKGLIMRPLRDVFALEYIEETQNAYELASQSSCHQKEELDWATSVLTKYYETVSLKDSHLLTRLANKFSKFNSVKPSNTQGFKKIPYKHHELKSKPLTFEEFSQFINIRRSTRWFKQMSVCRNKIKQAITLASQAPSACNRQPYEFYVVDQQPLLSQVSKLAIGGGGFANNIPCLIAVVGDYSCYEHERDRHVIYIDASLAAMQFMQALPTLGLASCPMNWPELSVVDTKIATLLKLPNYKKTIMLIAVGEPELEGGIPYSQKKSAEQLVHFVETV
jgi:nitroreductase